MPYMKVPAFLEQVRQADAVAARAIEFLILTAARSGEVLGAQWDEIDFYKAIWTVPAGRMKTGKEHRVPLLDPAMEILKPLHEARLSEYIFPGQKPGKPLSGMAMTMFMRRLNAGEYTVHGFRSSFRDWAAEETHAPREIAEAALAHQVGNAVERAYRRGDVLEKRRELMEARSRHCQTPTSDNVVKLHG